MVDRLPFTSSPEDAEHEKRNGLSINELKAHLMGEYMSRGQVSEALAKNNINKTLGGMIKYFNANFENTNESEGYIYDEYIDGRTERFLGVEAIGLIKQFPEWRALTSGVSRILRANGNPTNAVYQRANIPTKIYELLRASVIELAEE